MSRSAGVVFTFDAATWERPAARHAIGVIASLLEWPTRLAAAGARDRRRGGAGVRRRSRPRGGRQRRDRAVR